jgi:hypothetical protein
MGRRHQTLFSRAAAGQPGAHTNRPNCWKSRQLGPLVSFTFPFLSLLFC